MSDTVQKADELLGNTTGQFFDAEYAAHLEKRVRGGLPYEKEAMREAGARIARDVEKEGSVQSTVMGQKMASIPARVYHRWNLEWPGCWNHPEFVEAFLTDNPEFRNKGYKSKSYATRKGITYLGGVPQSPHSALAP